MGRRVTIAFALVCAWLTPSTSPSAQQQRGPATFADAILLAPTNHPRLPADVSQLWLVPEKTRRPPNTPGIDQFVEAVKLEVESNFAHALPIFAQLSLDEGPLGSYAEYYKGLAELRLGRPGEARATFRALANRAPIGYVAEAAVLREAESDEALADYAGALVLYEQLSKAKTTAPDDVLMRLGRAAKAVGDSDKAATAFSRLYFEFPFSDLSPDAGSELELIPNYGPIATGSRRYKLEVGRAERLFGAKRYAAARAAFQKLRGAAQGDDRELVALRLAECDYFLKRPRNTRDGVRPYLEKASLQGEALFFYAIASRKLGNEGEYLRTVRRVVNEFPNQSWCEEALNSLATHYIIKDEDEKADETFREMYEKFPRGHYAERAAWKIGWKAYKEGKYSDTTRIFESAAADFPRSDYRPPWLYWSGRAHEALKETGAAEARYALAATDYLNSYYGRLATRRLDGRAPRRRLVIGVAMRGAPVATNGGAGTIEPPPSVALPPNEAVVRALLALDLYDQAIDELRYAQKVWGNSSAIEATLAWIYRQQGRTEAGGRQFTLYRGAINAMKRAYPQYMAAGGEELPRDVLTVIFPIGYWDLIRKHAAEYRLDPYLVAALVSQESTFVADIRSSANAYGLMQLVPATGRQLAKRLKLPYSRKLLTNPEANIRMGTAYLADQIREFGDLHLVLAGYNAGEAHVHRWVAERAGMDREEFIDDIPFPETQNYVKKILGTAEDFRRLYGSEQEDVGDLAEVKTAMSRSGAPAVKAKPAPRKRKPRGAA